MIPGALALGMMGGVSPQLYFADGNEGFWVDTSDISTLWQDTAGTIPVTAAGQSVARVDDKSGNGYHFTQSSAPDRPTYQVDETGRGYLSFAPTTWLNGPSSLYTLFSGADGDFWVDAASGGETTQQFWFNFQYASGQLNILSGFIDSNVEGNTFGNRAAISGHPYKTRNTFRLVSDASGGSNSFTINNSASASQSFAPISAGNATTVRLGNFNTEDRAIGGGFYEMIALPTTSLPESTAEQFWEYFRQRAVSYDLYLAAGQSNAEGQGVAASAPSVDAGTAYEFDGTTLEDIADPVGTADTGSAWPAFADGYYATYGRVPLITTYTVSGSAQTAEANVSAGYWQKGQTIYDNAIARAQDMQTEAATYGLKYRWKGVLWCQGERDAQAIDSGGGSYLQSEYEAGFDSMWADMKADIGGGVKIYISRTGTKNSGDTTGFSEVRAAQDGFATDNDDVIMGFTNAVNFPGLGYMADDLHYTQDGYNAMGAGLQASIE